MAKAGCVRRLRLASLTGAPPGPPQAPCPVARDDLQPHLERSVVDEGAGRQRTQRPEADILIGVLDPGGREPGAGQVPTQQVLERGSLVRHQAVERPAVAGLGGTKQILLRVRGIACGELHEGTKRRWPETVTECSERNRARQESKNPPSRFRRIGVWKRQTFASRSPKGRPGRTPGSSARALAARSRGTCPPPGGPGGRWPRVGRGSPPRWHPLHHGYGAPGGRATCAASSVARPAPRPSGGWRSEPGATSMEPEHEPTAARTGSRKGTGVPKGPRLVSQPAPPGLRTRAWPRVPRAEPISPPCLRCRRSEEEARTRVALTPPSVAARRVARPRRRPDPRRATPLPRATRRRPAGPHRERGRW